MDTENFEYYAFISYNHQDKETARKLQKRLERYHMPAKLLESHPDLPKKLSPIFRDESDITGIGPLIDTLKKNLEKSKYLILICSPASAKSPYVNAEADYFINTLHREGRIIPLIVGGLPHSKDPELECFPPAILDLPRELEPLGIDLKEFGESEAFLRVIATLLQLNFTYVKKRDDEERKRRLMIFSSMAAALAVIVVGLAWYGMRYKSQYDGFILNSRGDEYYNNNNYAQAREWWEINAFLFSGATFVLFFSVHQTLLYIL